MATDDKLPVKLDYTNVERDSQPILWKMFRYDPAMIKLTTNVLDKEPENFNAGVGYPLFIIPEAEIGSDTIVSLRKHELLLHFNCSIYTVTTPTMRTMIYTIREIVAKNRLFLGAYGLNNATIESKVEPFILDDGRRAYRADLIITLKIVVNGMLTD